ncbi:MAG: tail fiber domain-containing protein [Marinilabiliales bacterium]|nr:tail fiber domain-containing protein [Marinilabiliales bacterium]
MATLVLEQQQLTFKLQVVGNTAIGQFTNGTAVIDAFSGYAYYGCNNATNGLSIGGTGNIGIGTTNPGSYKLYVTGSAYSTGGWSSSDVRLKKNIVPISSILSKLMAGYCNYEWKTDEYKDLNFDTGTQLGVIAQDVESFSRTSKNRYKWVQSSSLRKSFQFYYTEGLKEQETKNSTTRRKSKGIRNPQIRTRSH